MGAGLGQIVKVSLSSKKYTLGDARFIKPCFCLSMALKRGVFSLALLGFASLGAQPAHAFFTGCGTTTAVGNIQDLPTSCVVGDKIYSDFSTDLPSNALITIGEGGPTGKQHNLTVSGAGLPGATFFNYKITISGSSNYLLSWQTDASSSIAPNDYTVATTFSNSAAGTVTIDQSTGASGINPFKGEPTTTDVTHTFTNAVTLNSFTSTVTQGPADPVPAPLPMFGAAVVYGSVQRLRRSSKRLQVLVSSRG